MERVCMITGGAGFIGCAVSKRLLHQFDRVIAVDVLHPQIHPAQVRPKALPDNVELMVADVTHEDVWNGILSKVKPHTILHLAAETGTGQSLTQASRHANVNVVGTTRMLDALSIHGIPSQIILASSRAVYGEGAWADALTHEVVYPGQRSNEQLARKEWDFGGKRSLPFEAVKTSPRPSSIYAATKLAQENILESWCQSSGVKITILRLQNVYGPGQSLINSYTGIVTLFARLARSGEQIPVYEDGAITRDFVFIDDVASAIEAVAKSDSLPQLCYDIGSGQTTTILELAKKISNYYDAPSPIITGRYRNGDVRHASCNIARSIADLDWQPTWDLDPGLIELFRWMDSN
jgi:dTDP-L-rhamnose 4-epimerase